VGSQATLSKLRPRKIKTKKYLKPEPTEEQVDTDGWHTERHPRTKTKTGILTNLCLNPSIIKTRAN
jgi:hypothetical protein